MLNEIGSPLISIDAIDQVPKGVPKHVYSTILMLSQSKTGGLSFNLTFKTGARVMLTSNIDISEKLINGQIGTVAHVSSLEGIVKNIYVKLDDRNAGHNRIDSDKFAREIDAVPLEKVTTEIRTKAKNVSSPVIKRTQFPLMLAWACTVHKVQGLSLDKIVVNFNLFKQKSFNHGQMYVALSRVTSLQGLYLTRKYNIAAISSDESVKREYEYLRENQSLNMLEIDTAVLDNNLVLTVSNVRSLIRHVNDIKSDMVMVSSDLILCTETQLGHSKTQ